MTAERQPLRLLTFGASLTAGYYQFGLAYHPYAKHLSELFASVQIPTVIDQKDVSGERVVSNMWSNDLKLYSKPMLLPTIGFSF